MDLLELQTLADELAEDAAIAARAFALAARRLEERSPAGYDSSAHHLARCYNVIAQMALRVAKAFENVVDDEKGWPRLIQTLLNCQTLVLMRIDL